jgi:hypothetical protein
VGAVLPGDLGESLDDVWRRPNLGIPAPEVDQGRSVGRGGSRNAREELREVLRGEPVESRRPGSHGASLAAEDRVEDEVVQLAVVCPHDEAGPGLRLAAAERDLPPSMCRDREADLFIVRRDKRRDVDCAPGSTSNRA